MSFALNFLNQLESHLPEPSRSPKETLALIDFLELQIPAHFAVAIAGPAETFPHDQFFSRAHFPVFQPRSLEEMSRTRSTVTEPINQVILIPCIQGSRLAAALMVYPLQPLNEALLMIIDVTSKEIARSLTGQLPGLALHRGLKGKSKKSVWDTISLVGKNPTWQAVIENAERVAPTNASVLILGQSGTGKELVAKRIHQLSPRKEFPFIAINCGAISEHLLESELFGHEKGAFTGAYVQKRGLIELAKGGTLFLDEIGELPLSLQAKLLRFLQEGEFYRVGGKELITVDVRLVSATNRNLIEEVRDYRFREDLYYRLNTVSLNLPSLKDRMDDLPLLIEHFAPGLLERCSSQTLQKLMEYPWPGNVRELQNIIERLLILGGQGTIEVQDLPEQFHTEVKDVRSKWIPKDWGVPVDLSLEELEKRHIFNCLDHTGGNKTRTAQILGVTIKTLYNKLHRYGIFDKTEANL